MIGIFLVDNDVGFLLIVAVVLLVWKGFNIFKATAVFFVMLAATRGSLIDVSSPKQHIQIAVK